MTAVPSILFVCTYVKGEYILSWFFWRLDLVLNYLPHIYIAIETQLWSNIDRVEGIFLITVLCLELARSSLLVHQPSFDFSPPASVVLDSKSLGIVEKYL